MPKTYIKWGKKDNLLKNGIWDTVCQHVEEQNQIRIPHSVEKSVQNRWKLLLQELKLLNCSRKTWIGENLQDVDVGKKVLT